MTLFGPRAKRILFAMLALPAAGYGGYRAYQHLRPPAPSDEKAAVKEAAERTLRRYGLKKEALSPQARNMLIGAGVGGVAGAGLNYTLHHDEPDAGSRAAKAGLGGALLGLIAGGVLTPQSSAHVPVSPSSRQPPDSQALREAAGMREVARQGEYNRAHQELVDHIVSGGKTDSAPSSRFVGLVHEPVYGAGPRSLWDSSQMTPEEFDRLMLDPNTVMRF